MRTGTGVSGPGPRRVVPRGNAMGRGRLGKLGGRRGKGGGRRADGAADPDSAERTGDHFAAGLLALPEAGGRATYSYAKGVPAHRVDHNFRRAIEMVQLAEQGTMAVRLGGVPRAPPARHSAVATDGTSTPAVGDPDDMFF